MAFDISKELYPFEPNYFVHKSGLKQHYVDEGHGEPMVMVHGNPTWSFLFRDLIKEFSPTFRTIAVDHIGCGLSDKPDINTFPYRIKDHADNLEALIESFHFDKPITLVLHDWGGVIGSSYAVKHPDKIKRLILLDTAAFRLPPDCVFPKAIWLFRHTELGTWLSKNYNAFSRIAAWLSVLKPMSKEVRHGFTAPYNTPENRIATYRFVLDVPLESTDHSYNDLVAVENGLSLLADKPALVCFGRYDVVFKRQFFHRWKQLLPQAQMHNFRAGHYILEDVGPAVFKLIHEFIAQNH